jgi:vacuolar-type H+-ATPase subunit F/Vma7
MYHVILILTDGVIHDMRETIDEIVECSKLPLSVIIVGIGDADFTNMGILDADDMTLMNSEGKEMKRDIVQFVEFNEVGGNTEVLAEKVLGEVPDQLVSYMQKNNIQPDTQGDSSTTSRNKTVKSSDKKTK